MTGLACASGMSRSKRLRDRLPTAATALSPVVLAAR